MTINSSLMIALPYKMMLASEVLTDRSRIKSFPSGYFSWQPSMFNRRTPVFGSSTDSKRQLVAFIQSTPVDFCKVAMVLSLEWSGNGPSFRYFCTLRLDFLGRKRASVSLPGSRHVC